MLMQQEKTVTLSKIYKTHDFSIMSGLRLRSSCKRAELFTRFLSHYLVQGQMSVLPDFKSFVRA